MTAIRAVLTLLGAGFAFLIVRAIATGDFASAGNWLMSDPWGLVTLADLYLGFALAAVVIAAVERGWARIVWILPIPFLGNVWTVLWFVLRLPEIWRRLRRPAS